MYELIVTAYIDSYHFTWIVSDPQKDESKRLLLGSQHFTLTRSFKMLSSPMRWVLAPSPSSAEAAKAQTRGMRFAQGPIGCKQGS